MKLTNLTTREWSGCENNLTAKNAKEYEYPPNSRKLPTGQAISNIEQAKKDLA